MITNQTLDAIFVECSLTKSTQLLADQQISSSNHNSNSSNSSAKVLRTSGEHTSAHFLSAEPQPSATYHLELYRDPLTPLALPLVNVSNPSAPSFSVSGLSPGSTYLLVIYAANERGKSHSIKLTSSTLAALTRKHGKFFRTLRND